MRDDETGPDEGIDELSGEERHALASLPGERPPPPALEERVVAALRQSGALRPGARAGRWRPVLRVAAVLALTVAGALAGRWTAPGGGDVTDAPRFLLLLHEPPGWVEGGSRRVAEYAAWAGTLRDEGRYVSGAPLRDEERVLEPAPASGGHRPPGGLRLGGYFLIGAVDLDEAATVAAGCPHLAHGGTVAVRPLGS